MNMDKHREAPKASKSLVLEQLQPLARRISDEFLAARQASLPASVLATEVRHALEEALEPGIERPFDATRFYFAQIFQRRLADLWQRWWPGLPEFSSDVAPTAGWQAAVLAARARQRRIASSARAIPIYHIRAASDRTLTVAYDRPAGWRNLHVPIDPENAVYGIQIPRALASEPVREGTLALLDASPAETWRPPPGGIPALIAVAPLAHPSTIVQWFGHLADLDALEASVRQSAESTISLEISRNGIVIHPIVQILD